MDIDKNKIDCKYTKEIVCPYCGYVFSDSWEHHLDCHDECYDGDVVYIDCGECAMPFCFYVDMSVTYVSLKNEENNKQCKLSGIS